MSIGERPRGPRPPRETPAAPSEAQERSAARRSLRARLAGGALLQAVGHADLAGMRWTRSQARSPQLTHAIRSYSRLGEHGAAWLILGAAGAALDRQRRADWASGIGGVAAAYLVNTTLKQIARRPRPNIVDLPPLIPTPGPLSFPSSHAASSAAAVIGFGGLIPRTPLAICASAMAVSRVHLGVHYPSDIAVGAALGTIVARTVRRRVADTTATNATP